MSDPAALRAALHDLAQRGEALQDLVARVGDEIRERAVIAPPVATRVELDADGLVSSVRVDPDLRHDLDPQELASDVARAFAVAHRDRPAAEGAGSDLRAALDALEAGAVPLPVRISDDFGHVAVTAVNGIASLAECDPDWLASAPVDAIDAEVTRLARTAALESDVLGRHGKDAS